MSDHESDDVDRAIREVLKKEAMLGTQPNLLKGRPVGNIRGGSTTYARRGRVRIHAGKKSSDESDSESELRAELRKEALQQAKALSSKSHTEGSSRGRTTFAKRGGKAIGGTSRRKAPDSALSTYNRQQSVKLLIPQNMDFLKPLRDGWVREIVYRNIVSKSASADIYYTSPDGVKFRSGKEIERYFEAHPEKKGNLEPENFTFKRVMLGWEGPEEYERNAYGRRRSTKSATPMTSP